MTKHDSQKLKQYYRQIRLLIPYGGKDVRRFMRDFKHSVREYCEANPHASAEETMDFFGSPEQIALEFISSSDMNHLYQKLFVKKYFIIILFILFAVILVTELYWNWILSDISYQQDNTTIVQETMAVEEFRAMQEAK